MYCWLGTTKGEELDSHQTFFSWEGGVWTWDNYNLSCNIIVPDWMVIVVEHANTGALSKKSANTPKEHVSSIWAFRWKIILWNCFKLKKCIPLQGQFHAPVRTVIVNSTHPIHSSVTWKHSLSALNKVLVRGGKTLNLHSYYRHGFSRNFLNSRVSLIPRVFWNTNVYAERWVSVETSSLLAWLAG